MINVRNFAFKFVFASALLVTVSSCVEKGETEPCPCNDTVDGYDTGILSFEEARRLYVTYQDRRIKPLIQKYEDSIDQSREGYKKRNESEQNNQTGGTMDPYDDNGGNFDVARYVSYEYKDIKEYLAYIENEAELSGEKISTLRFYFGNYPEDLKFPNNDTPKHPRQNTIMISPTIKKNDKENIFYTIDTEGGKRKAILLTDRFQESDNSDGIDTPKQLGEKSEASFVPDLFSPSSSAPFYAAHYNTKNEGNSAPPPHAQQ